MKLKNDRNKHSISISNNFFSKRFFWEINKVRKEYSDIRLRFHDNLVYVDICCNY